MTARRGRWLGLAAALCLLAVGLPARAQDGLEGIGSREVEGAGPEAETEATPEEEAAPEPPVETEAPPEAEATEAEATETATAGEEAAGEEADDEEAAEPEAPTETEAAGEEAAGEEAAGEEAAGEEAVAPGQDAEDLPLPEGHEAEVELTVDTGEDGLRTGDLARVTIAVTVAEGDDVAIPEQSLEPFELFDRRSSSEPAGEGRRRFTFELDLLALEPGEANLPALRIRVVTADGTVGAVSTEPQELRVGSHLANEPEAEPRGATDPVSVLEEDYTLLWVLGVLGALLLTALLAFLFGRWWRRRPKAIAPPPPPRPAWERALEQLADLRGDEEALLAAGRQVELVDRVSDIVRDYLGRRYDFNGLESTSDEVIGRLRKVKLRIELSAIQGLLADSDLVKFAKAMPDEEQCDRMLDGAEHIIRATAPRPGQAAHAAGKPKKKKPKKKTKKKKRKKPAESAGGARIVAADGSVTLPLAPSSIAEAEHEIGAAVGAAARDHAERPEFDGTITVALSPELPASPEVDEALTRVHGLLADELDQITTARGRPVRLVIEHFHGRLYEAAERGEPVRVTIVDDMGARVEERHVAPEPGSSASRAAAPPEAESHATTGPAPESAAEDVSAAEPASAGQSEAPAASQPSTATPPEEDAAAEPAPREVGRQTTPEPSPEAPPTAVEHAATIEDASVAKAAREAVASSGLRVLQIAFPEALTRVQARFHIATEGASDEPLLRWVAGVERPIVYVLAEQDGEALLGPDALRGIGVTRRQLHDRALERVRDRLPPRFAPGSRAAELEDGHEALLVLPELVAAGDRWLAYPSGDGSLFVMKEGADRTRSELSRLRDQRRPDDPFSRPVRVTREGFSPADWPADSARPALAVPPPKRPARSEATPPEIRATETTTSGDTPEGGDISSTLQGDAFGDLRAKIEAARNADKKGER